MKKINFKSLLFNCLVPLMLSFTIMMLVPYDKEYYQSISVPFKLPIVIFIIIWSIMYVLMGLSGYYTENIDLAPKIIKIYYLQLILNLLFMPIFFYFKNVFLNIILLALLFTMTLIYAIKILKIKKAGFYVLIPYLIWLFFILYLLLGIHFLN